jgi:hypothetical protein
VKAQASEPRRELRALKAWVQGEREKARSEAAAFPERVTELEDNGDERLRALSAEAASQQKATAAPSPIPVQWRSPFASLVELFFHLQRSPLQVLLPQLRLIMPLHGSILLVVYMRKLSAAAVLLTFSLH